MFHAPTTSPPRPSSPLHSGRGKALLVAGALSACALFPTPIPPNLSAMSNGSFEVTEGKAPLGWALTSRPMPGSEAFAEIDPAHKRHGQQALRLEVAGSGFATATSEPFLVEARQPYLLSAYYKASGMGSDAAYQGANARIELTWLGANGPIGRETDGFPYQDVPWSRALRIAIAPETAVKAIVRARLDARTANRRVAVWIDDVRFRAWSTRPLRGGKRRTWNAAELAIEQRREDFRPVADDDATTGRSVIANPRYHEAAGYLFTGVYPDDLAPGAYRVDFRIKGEPDERSSVPIVGLDVIAKDVVNTTLVERTLSAEDLAGTPPYRTFSLPLIVPPTGWVSFRAYWRGGTPVWIDTVAVTEERLENEGGFADVLAP